MLLIFFYQDGLLLVFKYIRCLKAAGVNTACLEVFMGDRSALQQKVSPFFSWKAEFHLDYQKKNDTFSVSELTLKPFLLNVNFVC